MEIILLGNGMIMGHEMLYCYDAQLKKFREESQAKLDDMKWELAEAKKTIDKYTSLL